MLEDQDLERYARQVIMPEIGEEGQRRLMEAKVLVIGAGGLGTPVMLYLAAAGVGRISIADDESVELSNLNRQITHRTDGIGSAKTAQVADAVAALNPRVSVAQLRCRLDEANSDALVADHELVIDCSDSFETRLLAAGAAHRNARPHVFGGAVGMQGQLAVFTSGIDASGVSPCFCCVFPEMPDARQAPGCSQAGILGPVTGVIGSMQALEAMKLVTGMGSSLVGRLLVFDGSSAEFMEIQTRRREDCPVCSGSR